MNSRELMRSVLACGISLGAFVAPAMAQNAPDSAKPAAEEAAAETMIVVTGSRIKQDPTKSALPLEIITNVDIERNGIANPEALNMFLTANGSGADNLASNSDVVTGAQRGTNGLAAANLRGQGSAATLILLNGRRVAAHGLSGGAVDVNQIPFAAIDRVEILKDGASAIYGTDAIGGVINYVTKKNFQGASLAGSVDVTEQGGGNIYRLSGVMGYGDLDEDGINIMGAVSYSWNHMLRGSQRDFVNGNQSSRGLSVDTRGTPIASIFPVALTPLNATLFPNGSLFGGTNSTYRPTPSSASIANPYYLSNFYFPGTTTIANGGVNILDIPGGAGCDTMDGGMAYDTSIWTATSGAAWACAWDTGRATVIQQPIQTLTYYTKATINLGGGHQLSAELTGSDANSAKSFSHAQLSTNGTNFAATYPLNALTQTQYDAVFNSLVAAFAGSPAQAGLLANYGDGIGFRWRCIACGPREYKTHTRTLRAMVSLEGPLPFSGWDYRVSASHAESESSSVLGSGYYYRGTLNSGANDPLAPVAPGATGGGLVGMLNAGILNPFSVEQSAAAMAGLQAISAYGTTLYGGRYTVKEVDASLAGPLFDVPGGTVQMAVGVDWRRETYGFNGSPAAATNQPVIMLAAFDNVNALIPKNRTVKAAFVEVDVPILDMLTVTGAFRIDDYSGFGTTTNPKVSVKFTPTEWLMFRGSYSTGFRVPSFNQIFNGVTETNYSGSDIVDPVSCPSLVASSTDPNCAFIRPVIWTGGNVNLGPEKAKMASVGVVFRPKAGWSLSADWWMINVDGTIQDLSISQLLQNAALFPERFIRDSSGDITVIDRRWFNAGSRRTQGVEFALRGGFDLSEGNRISIGMDGSLLLKKREKLLPSAPFGPSLVGVFTLTGDLGLRWKHNAWVSYTSEDWAVTFTQIFRAGYANRALPGSAAQPDYNARVKPYHIYNLSASYLGLGPQFRITMGIKNIFNTDPPFAITYDDNTGAGSSWEPRVADPRGRSFNVAVEVRF